MSSTPMHGGEAIRSARDARPSADAAPCALSITPLSDIFGAQVDGVDIGVSLDEPTIAAIQAAFLDHQFLVFRGQSLSRAAQVRFTGYFGELELPLNREYWGSDFPEVHTVSNLDKDGNPTAAKALANPGNFFWHTDGSYLEAPPACSMLYSVEVPPIGGNTSFVSMYHAYESLSASLRERVDGQRLVHSWAQSRINSGSRPPTAQELKEAPPVAHPLVRTHPQTGRKGLYMGNHSSHMEGMDAEESRALLAELTAHATRAEVIYEHKWRVGDLAMWDNRCLLHCASTEFDMAHERRILHRTVLSGTVPV